MRLALKGSFHDQAVVLDQREVKDHVHALSGFDQFLLLTGIQLQRADLLAVNPAGNFLGKVEIDMPQFDFGDARLSC